MSDFGNFLLGAMEGLDYGARVGERLASGRADRDARKAAKKVAVGDKASDAMATAVGGMDRAQNPGQWAPPGSPSTAPIRPAPIDPAAIAPPQTMAQHMPGAQPQPQPAARAAAIPPPPAAPEFNPARTHGVQVAAPYDTQFPGAIARYGVLGQPYPPDNLY